MAEKKTEKKTAAKAAPKKAAPKKAPAKKAAAKAAPKKAAAKAAAAQPKRPPNNPEMPQEQIDKVNSDLNDIRYKLDNYAAHLRALDRKRMNGVGIKTQGFIERAYEYALSNPEFLPHYLSLEKFQEDHEYFVGFRNMYDTCKQILEIVWNITLQSADIVYTDALEFYASVREASKRRVDAAETMYGDLEDFFRKHKRPGEEPTDKELKRDANALLRGKRDGKIVIENIAPKIVAGKRKVLDEKFTDTAQFKETEEGEIKE